MITNSRKKHANNGPERRKIDKFKPGDEAHFLSLALVIMYCVVTLWAYLHNDQTLAPEQLGVGIGALASGLGAWLGLRDYGRANNRGYNANVNSIQVFDDSNSAKSNSSTFVNVDERFKDNKINASTKPDRPD